MANIQVEQLYERMQREFATMGASLPRFESDFLDATNDATAHISQEANLETAIPRIDSLEAEISLSDAYMRVLARGIAMYLMLAGKRPAKKAEEAIKTQERLFLAGINTIRQDLLHAQVVLANAAEDNFDGPFGLSRNYEPTYR